MNELWKKQEHKLDPRIELIYNQTDREFRGHTFNGKSLMETCRLLTGAQAANTDTYEGYSAWENLVHCVYFKYVMLRHLGGSGPVDPYPWKQGSFVAVTDTSQKAWEDTMDYAVRVHDAYLAALDNLFGTRLDERMEEWECTVAEGLVWVATHDTYHTAQIRNMGLPELRKPHKKQ